MRNRKNLDADPAALAMMRHACGKHIGHREEGSEDDDSIILIRAIPR